MSSALSATGGGRRLSLTRDGVAVAPFGLVDLLMGEQVLDRHPSQPHHPVPVHLVLRLGTPTLRWIAILHGRVDASLAATTGVHTWRDVAKVLLAGADVAMMASAVLREGPEHVARVTDHLHLWLLENGYASIQQLKGSVSQEAVADPADFERANYVRMLTSYARTFLPS